MSSLDDLPVLEPLRRAHEEGRLAHAFLIVGSPEGDGCRLAEAMAQMLYCEAAEKPCGVCDGCLRVSRKDHPDVYWLEPTKKSRIFSVDQIRELNANLGRTSYAGSWKTAILLFADRMKTEAMNALLKTMEEPPGRTLIVLVTDQVQGLLPTIISRCQRINLGEREQPPEGLWRAELEAWLAEAGARGPLTAMARASRLLRLLDQVKAEIEEDEKRKDGEGGEGEIEDEDERDRGDEFEGEGAAESRAREENVARDVRVARIASRLIKERTAILRAIQLWQRDVLACKMGAPEDTLHYRTKIEVLRKQASACDVGVLFARIRAVDEAQGRLGTNLNVLMVLDAMVRAGV